jgi:1,4-alpha-glucan branching enzyme
VITLDATKGNQGLMGYTPATDVYVHMGVITNKSTSSSNWRYVKNFGVSGDLFSTAVPQLQATAAGTNKWQYTITGSLRTFFGITDATETIQKIALLFRTGNGSKKQTNSDGSDLYIPIYTSALAIRFTAPLFEPRYTPVAETLTKSAGDQLTITALSNKAADLEVVWNGVVHASAPGVTSITDPITLTAPGSQTVVIRATSGAETATDTLRFFVAPAVVTSELPAGVREGINYEAGNTAVTLVLKAPFKNRVGVIGEFPGSNWTEQTSYTMNKTADGKYWWIRISGLTPGTEYAYQYVVDGSLKIADPYAEKILDPYNNNDQTIPAATYPGLRAYPAGQSGIVSVLQTAQPAYSWSVPNFSRPDKRGLVIYELLVRDFVAAHDWKTIKDSLNYLKNLGINAIEIMPFNEFEGNNSWGYNPDFYFAPDKYYGTKNSLKEFIDSCHKKGIAVIMDIALNHSFGLSPMVQLYFDAANNRPAANNPWFNPVAKHDFNVGYDMNHESLDTRYFVSRVTEHWLTEYKIDGFRFDLSKGFTQTQTCDNNGANCNVSAWSSTDNSRIAIWKRYYDTVQTKSAGSYVILEHFASDDEETQLSNYGMMLWGNLNYNYNQASMGYSTDWDFSRVLHSTRGWTNPYLVGYMESHDEERLMFKNLNYGNTAGSYSTKDLTTALKRMEQNAAFFLTVPGPKMIWQFGELGYDYSINTCTDGTVSNDCRLAPKPIRWDYLTDARRKALYTTYSNLNRLRFLPSYQQAFLSGTVDKSLSSAVKWIKLSSGDTSHLVVVGNFDVAAQSGTVTFPAAGTWYDYLNNTTFTATGSAQSINLQPGEYHVYLNRNVNNVTSTPVVNVPWNGTTLEALAFPNPSASNFTVEIKLPQRSAVSIDLYSHTGQYIAQVYNGFAGSGTRQIPVKRNGLPAGIYYLHVKTKTAVKTLSVTIQ